MAKLEIHISNIMPIQSLIRQVESDTFDFIVEDDALHSELNQLGITLEDD